jgi:hypothetical protein
LQPDLTQRQCNDTVSHKPLRRRQDWLASPPPSPEEGEGGSPCRGDHELDASYMADKAALRPRENFEIIFKNLIV